MRIHPFPALRPQPGLVTEVASVPYDVVDTAEAAALAQGHPLSCLHVSRAEIDLPKGIDPHADAVYQKARANFEALQQQQTLLRESTPCLYLYRLKRGDHTQRGIVAGFHVEDYEQDLIKKHEKTRKDKEDDRTRHIGELRAHTGPVFLTYRDQPDVERLVATVERETPLYDFTAADGIAHTIWRVAQPQPLTDAFRQVPVAYIADGHHRAASAVRVAKDLRAANPRPTGQEEYNWFQAVIFPASQLAILPYNRCVRDLNGLTESDFLKAVRARFQVTEPAAPSPAAPGQISLYLGRRWYGLRFNGPAPADPVSALDVSLLQNHLLDPILGIRDPRTDQRIDFVGGIRGTAELEKRVAGGQAAVAFSMFPTTVDQLMAIADAGQIMPPKSTWFEPKLRDGLLIHTF